MGTGSIPFRMMAYLKTSIRWKQALCQLAIDYGNGIVHTGLIRMWSMSSLVTTETQTLGLANYIV